MVKQKEEQAELKVKRFWRKRMGEYGQQRVQEVELEEQNRLEKEGILIRLMQYESMQLEKL